MKQASQGSRRGLGWKKTSAVVSLLALLGGVGGASIAGATAGIDPAPPAGSGGWYASGQPTTAAQPGSTVSLTVTDVPPGAEDANGTFAISWPTGTLSYVGNGDTSATCSQAPSGGLTTETCAYTDLAHSSKSDSFRFTVAAPAGVTIPVQAVVTDTDDSTSANSSFPLIVPASAGQNGANGVNGSNGSPGAVGAQGPAGPAGTSASNGGNGYWLVAKDGGVFAFGGAQFYGSLPSSGITFEDDIVNIIPTTDGQGYWLVGADGAVYAFGDAISTGNMQGTHLNQPMIAGAPS